MASNGYEYLPLDSTKDEIRLLRVPKSASDSPPTQYSLRHVSLQDKPTFVALSYHWGQHSSDRPITIDGQQTYITVNLAVALRHMEGPVRLWVDAVCINQADLVEKTWQVQLMRNIYSAADEVLIWLGPSTDGTNRVMGKIYELGNLLLKTGLLDVVAAKRRDFVPWFMKPEDDRSVAPSTRRRVIDVMMEHRQLARDGIDSLWWINPELNERQWFRRVWCIQECVNARTATLCCGNAKVDYGNVQAVTWFYRLFCLFLCGEIQDHAPDFEAMRLLINKWQIFNGPMPSTILDIRQRSKLNSDFTLRHFLGLTNTVSYGTTYGIDASDDRDRVYALLGVATDRAAREIIPNYKLPCREVYVTTARVLLTHGHWDIFSLCRGENRKYSLPSWVPDWSTIMEQPWSMAVSTPADDYNACGHLVNRGGEICVKSGTSDELRLEAMLVNTISKTGDVYASSTAWKWDWPPLKQYFCDLQIYLMQSTMYSPPEKLEAEWRIPVADMQYNASNKHYDRASPGSHMAAGYLRAKEVHGWSSDGVAQTFYAEASEGFLPVNSPYTCYVNQVSKMYNTRPFLSEKGYVGLCPREAEPGDMIVIIAGAKLPYILRGGPEGNTWKLVGEAYVHGIMDGEAVDMHTQTEVITLQ